MRDDDWMTGERDRRSFPRLWPICREPSASVNGSNRPLPSRDAVSAQQRPTTAMEPDRTHRRSRSRVSATWEDRRRRYGSWLAVRTV